MDNGEEEKRRKEKRDRRLNTTIYTNENDRN